MLVRYKRNHEKIAMGLLSFVPGEEDLKQLQKTMNEYESNKSWTLFLWKHEDISDFIGIIGVRLVNEETVELQHISVSPSHREQGIGKAMMDAVAELYKSRTLIPNKRTKAFYEQCGFTVEG